MAVAARRDPLAPIRDKILAGERLDFDDGVELLASDDILALGELADEARRLRGISDDVLMGDGVAPDEPQPTAPDDLVKHWLALRDEGAARYVPPAGDATTGHDDLRIIAVSRLVLDTVPVITADSRALTPELAQIALSFGANELQGPDPDAQRLLISEAGRTPVSA
jgi:2-iminoacetate synthase ThiH